MTSSLPDRYQEQAAYVRQRLHLDTARWFQPDEPMPYLKVVQEAVWQDCQLSLAYRRPEGRASQRMVSPYGLVAKAGIWYVVAAADTGLRVYRISRIETAALSQTHFVRPPDFDLAAFWTTWAAAYQANLPKYPVTLNIGPALAPLLPSILGDGVRSLLEQAQPDVNGWRVLPYTFERREEAQAYILGMGAGAEVIAPDELRTSVLRLATEIVAHYRSGLTPKQKVTVT